MWKRAWIACVLAACSSNAAGPLGITELPSGARLAASSPIKHVVFVVQENRSFNNLFMGYPGAKTLSYGYDTNGKKIALQPVNLQIGWDLAHNSVGFFAACDGTGTIPGTDCKMDGWNNELATSGHPPNPAYAYVPQSETKPYWTIAKRYVLADRTFASNFDGSFVSHQYAVAAYASRAVDYPVRVWGCEGGPSDTVATLTGRRAIGSSIAACFDNPTLAAEADQAGVSWRYYAGSIYGDGGLWSAYQADRRIYNGPDWKAKVIDPPSRFLTDVAAGKLAQITWVAPTYEASDHAVLDTGKGPAWIASVVNAVGKSKFWDSTAVFIMWDDWGGWYDPVKPRYLDYDGLGFRVPLLILLRRMQSKATSRTSTTKRRACCASSRIISDWATSRRATRARAILPRTPSITTSSRGSSSRSPARNPHWNGSASSVLLAPRLALPASSATTSQRFPRQ